MPRILPILMCLAWAAGCKKDIDPCEKATSIAVALLEPQLAIERKVVARSKASVDVITEWAAKLSPDQKEIGDSKIKGARDAVDIQNARIAVLESWNATFGKSGGSQIDVPDDAGEPNASDGFRRVRMAMQHRKQACQ